jgi:hypothetical protein
MGIFSFEDKTSLIGECLLSKLFKIEWMDTQKTTLQINYIASGQWSDILQANLEVIEIIKASPHDVILFHNAGKYGVDLTSIGAIKDLLYNKVPPVPTNLRCVIVMVDYINLKFQSIKIAMDILDKTFYKRKLNYFVTTMEEVEQLIQKFSMHA